MDGLALLENTFKEIGVSFTDKNQLSVAKLLNTMKLDDVISYIKELHEGVSQDKNVKDIPALFSAKLEKGERIVKKKIDKKELDKVEVIGTNEEQIREKIKKRANYWLDYYNVCKNYEAAVNGLMSDLSEYIEEYPGLCEEYYNKFDKQVNKIKEKKGA